MPLTAKADTTCSTATCESVTPDDARAMLAEAAAVDALFARIYGGPLQFAATVTSYLSPPADKSASDPPTNVEPPQASGLDAPCRGRFSSA